VLCGGAQMYVTHRKKFDPLSTGLYIIKVLKELYPRSFSWRRPPYEFERKRLPFDILIGNSWIRNAIDEGRSVSRMKARWYNGLRAFVKRRKGHLLYA
jgi:beta-N-acetylhexosaminidase